MFGYVVAPVGALSAEEDARYRAAYCGLCRALGKRHGALARFSLTYDMTFLTLLLQSLYEPEETSGSACCLPHPVKARSWQQSEITDYAADMTIALTWHKCRDDWQDDHDLKARAYADALKRGYETVRQRWPRQCANIERCMAEYGTLEKQQAEGGLLCACFGRLMRELFVYREDEWAGALRQLGTELGQFICLMDALMDAEQDRKHGSYNAMTAMQLKPEETYQMLLVLMGRVTAIFEKLPLVQDLSLLRQILYAGVWQQYNQAQEKKNKDASKPQDQPASSEGDNDGTGSV